MNLLKKWKKNLVIKCKSREERNQELTNDEDSNILPKCKSWPPWCSPVSSPVSSPRKEKRQVAPGGCFSVYVGPEKQRFVMKAKYANHPLFKMLLDDAEQQFGYNSEGPLLLPCDVDFFYKVLADMDCDCTDVISPRGCGGVGSYSVLSPSRLLKMNNF